MPLMSVIKAIDVSCGIDNSQLAFGAPESCQSLDHVVFESPENKKILQQTLENNCISLRVR